MLLLYYYYFPNYRIIKREPCTCYSFVLSLSIEVFVLLPTLKAYIYYFIYIILCKILPRQVIFEFLRYYASLYFCILLYHTYNSNE